MFCHTKRRVLIPHTHTGRRGWRSHCSNDSAQVIVNISVSSFCLLLYSCLFLRHFPFRRFQTHKELNSLVVSLNSKADLEGSRGGARSFLCSTICVSATCNFEPLSLVLYWHKHVFIIMALMLISTAARS